MYGTRLTQLLIGLINFVFGLVILALFLRLIFRLLGANPTAGIVEFLYNSTAPLLAPFRGIFPEYVIETGNVFEISTLIAIVFYAIIAWALVELILFIDYRGTTTYRRIA